MIKLERKSTTEMVKVFKELFLLDRMEFEATRIRNNIFLSKINYLEGYLELSFEEETQPFRDAQAIMDMIANNELDQIEVKTLDDDEIAEVLGKLIILEIFS